MSHPPTASSFPHTSHDYIGVMHDAAERRLGWVLLLTLLFMVVEIVAGYYWQSMALLADGWHMGSHAVALAIGWFGYRAAKALQRHDSYSFGGWKITVLAGFTSAVLLALVAVAIIIESVQHFWQLPAVNYADALGVAAIGLLVNGLSAYLLRPSATKVTGATLPHSHHHHHHHGAGCQQEHHGHDLNHRAAYVHVLADAATSVLALIALSAGLWFGWWWLDPAVGIIGGIMIAVWSWSLVRQTAAPLLDKTPDTELVQAIRQRLESNADHRILDLHLWQIGPQHFAVMVSVIAPHPLELNAYRHQLADLEGIAHLTIEIDTGVAAQ